VPSSEDVRIRPSALRPVTPDPTAAADDALAARALEGDHDALAALLSRHDLLLRRLAWALLRDARAMEELLAQVYCRAALGLASARDGATVRTWLARLTWQACVDATRPRWRRGTARARGTTSTATAHHGAGAGVDAGSDGPLAAALAELPADQRAVVLLVDAEGFGVDEAAWVLDVPAATAGELLVRARSSLRPGARGRA